MGKKEIEELSDKQLRFCNYYLELSNGTKAAIQAGYAEKSAHVEASRLLRNDKIQRKLDALRAERRERINNRLASYAEKAAQELYKIAMQSDSDKTRVTALKDIMDRAGYKPIDRSVNQNEMSGKIEFGFVDPNQED